MIDRIIAMVGLIMMSAFFSGIETAFFSLSNLKVRHLVKKKRKNAKILQDVKNRPRDLLTTILIGNNLVNIAASALATIIAVDFFQNNVVGIVTGVMTLVILIFGEITPKSLALKYNEQIALFVAGPISTLMFILNPIVRVLELITKGITVGKTTQKRPIVTEEELKTMVEVGEKTGQIKESEKKMIHRIFKFDDLDVENIMTPRPDMKCININTKLKDIWKAFKKTGHTKIPVYEKNKDHIKGIVHLIDVLKYKNPRSTVRKAMRKAYFVPETKKIDSLLKAFQARKSSIAIVVDEHGVVSGLVTMEDVLEEIVGEIVEETDKISPDVRKTGKKSWTVLGKADIEEVNQKIGSNFHEDEDFESIGGYVLHRAGHIPQEGDEIKSGKYTITVSKIEDNRIIELKIKKK